MRDLSEFSPIPGFAFPPRDVLAQIAARRRATDSRTTTRGTKAMPDTAIAMRAKVTVQTVEPAYAGAEKVTMMPVVKDETFGPDGASENNTYARYTPSGGLWFVISNPNLVGKFKQGDTLYVDFTPAE